MQFSIYRLWLLVRKQWAENKQLYTLGLLALAGIIAACIIFNLIEYWGFEVRVQENTFIVGLMASGFIFATTVLNQFNQKATGISVLMLPASALEKLLMAAIYSMIVFPVCYFAVVYPLISLGHYVDHNIIGHPNPMFLTGADSKYLYVYMTFLVLQSVALFVTVLFRRYVLVKGIILVMVVFYGSALVNPFLTKAIIKIDPGLPIAATVKETYYDARHNLVDTRISKEALWTQIRPDVPYADLQISNWLVNRNIKGVDYISYKTALSNPYNYVFVLLLIISIPFLWVITWFRLKEMEL